MFTHRSHTKKILKHISQTSWLACFSPSEPGLQQVKRECANKLPLWALSIISEVKIVESRARSRATKYIFFIHSFLIIFSSIRYSASGRATRIMLMAEKSSTACRLTRALQMLFLAWALLWKWCVRWRQMWRRRWIGAEHVMNIRWARKSADTCHTHNFQSALNKAHFPLTSCSSNPRTALYIIALKIMEWKEQQKENRVCVWLRER